MLAEKLCSLAPVEQTPSDKQPETNVTEVLRRLRGGSQGALVRCGDGNLYVVKMNENPQGRNVLANEIIGSRLLHGLGFSAPHCRIVTVGQNILTGDPGLHFEVERGRVVPVGDLHFASEFLDKNSHTIYDWLPPLQRRNVINEHELLGLYVFDVWASHQDERQCIFRQNQTGMYEAFFIDNGHLFGGPNWECVSGRPYRSNLGHSTLLDSDYSEIEIWIELFRTKIPALLQAAIRSTPSSWYKDDIGGLEYCLLQRLAILNTLVATEIRDSLRPIRGSQPDAQSSPLRYSRPFCDGDFDPRARPSCVLQDYRWRWENEVCQFRG